MRFENGLDCGGAYIKMLSNELELDLVSNGCCFSGVCARTPPVVFVLDACLASCLPVCASSFLLESADCLMVSEKVRGQRQSCGASDVSGWLLSSDCQLVA